MEGSTLALRGAVGNLRAWYPPLACEAIPPVAAPAVEVAGPTHSDGADEPQRGPAAASAGMPNRVHRLGLARSPAQHVRKGRRGRLAGNPRSPVPGGPRPDRHTR